MSKRTIQRLYNHGNCVAVTLQRYILYDLGWVSGQGVIVELLEDKSGVVVRCPRPEDFGPVLPPRLQRDAALATK